MRSTGNEKISARVTSFSVWLLACWPNATAPPNSVVSPSAPRSALIARYAAIFASASESVSSTVAYVACRSV
jgi:hypothetical protein